MPLAKARVAQGFSPAPGLAISRERESERGYPGCSTDSEGLVLSILGCYQPSYIIWAYFYAHCVSGIDTPTAAAYPTALEWRNIITAISSFCVSQKASSAMSTSCGSLNPDRDCSTLSLASLTRSNSSIATEDDTCLIFGDPRLGGTSVPIQQSRRFMAYVLKIN